MSRPATGTCVYWRFKGDRPWKFGYVTYIEASLMRLGRWNGDVYGGFIVDPFEIEWRPI